MKKSDFYLEVQEAYMKTVDGVVKNWIDIINKRILNAAQDAKCEICVEPYQDGKDVVKELAKHYRKQGFSAFWDEDGCGGYFLEIKWRKKL